MDSFRIVLILVGALGIGALLAHGLWSVRRQQGEKLNDKPLKDLYQEHQDAKDKNNKGESGFDADGIGQVRVLGGSRQEPTLGDISTSEVNDTEAYLEPSIELNTAEPEPVVSTEPVAVQPLKATAEPSENNDEEPQPVAETPAESQPEASAEPAAAEPEPEDFLVLNIVSATGSEIQGSDLLQRLLTLGFKYGEMQIFHRHAEADGSGAVLFSMVNMMKPGTFDIDAMETFTTQGLSLFMTLPNAGDANQAFKMMLNAAQKLARELGAQVLDDTRSVLTNQKIRHYQERIREFERKQLIAK